MYNNGCFVLCGLFCRRLFNGSLRGMTMLAEIAVVVLCLLVAAYVVWLLR